MIEVGAGVNRIKVNDEVYIRLPEASRGTDLQFNLLQRVLNI